MLAFFGCLNRFYHLIEIPMHLILLKTLQLSKRSLHLVCRIDHTAPITLLIEVDVGLGLFSELLSNVRCKFPTEADGVRTV